MCELCGRGGLCRNVGEVYVGEVVGYVGEVGYVSVCRGGGVYGMYNTSEMQDIGGRARERVHV